MKYVDPYTLHHSERLVAMFCRVRQTGTQAVLDSFNVSSITDAGSGRTTVNIDDNMADENYTVCGAVHLYNVLAIHSLGVRTEAAGSFEIQVRNQIGQNIDYGFSVSVFGDPN